MSERDGYQHGVPCWVDTWQPDADAAAAKAAQAGGRVVVAPFGSLDGGRMAIVADPAGAVIGLWQPGRHRGAQRVNEASAYAMSMLHTPDPEGAAAFYGDLFGWTTESFGDATMFRLPGFVGGEPEQPVSREVVAVMMPARDGEPARWDVDFWIADTDAAVMRAAELGGTVVAGPYDTPTHRQALLADPTGATFTVSSLKLG